MKKSVLKKRSGFAQILTLGILFLIAIAIPVSTKLVQQNQENRSLATSYTISSKSCYVHGIPGTASDGGNDLNYVTNGSVFCKKNFWNTLYATAECKDGEIINEKKCDNSCVYTKKSISGAEVSTKAICRTDKGCTDLGGQCVGSKDAKDGENCIVNATTYGKIKTGLCWVGDNIDKTCCVPNSTATPTSRPTATPTSRPTATPTSRPTATPTPENGKCGTSKNKCISGTFADVSDTSTYYKWQCKGKNNGTTDNCKIRKPTSTSTPTLTPTPTSILNSTVNNTPTSTQAPVSDSSDTPIVSFKFTLAGVTPGRKCLGSWNKLSKIIGGNISSSVNKEYDDIPFSLVEGESVNGLQVFEVKNYPLDSTLANLPNTNNYLKVKGPKHAQMRFCKDGQTGKLDETIICNISFNGTEYDFTKYPILAGDVNGELPGKQDGMINGIDFSYIKIRIEKDDGVESCGKEGDLNLDGVVNGIDLQLVKNSLNTRDDE